MIRPVPVAGCILGELFDRYVEHVIIFAELNGVNHDLYAASWRQVLLIEGWRVTELQLLRLSAWTRGHLEDPDRGRR